MATEPLTHLPFSSGTLIPFPWGFVPKPTRKKASGAAPSYRRFRNWIVLVSLRMTASAEVPWASEGNLPKFSSVGASKSNGMSTCPKFAVNFRHHTASQRMSLSFLPPGNLRRTFWSLYGLNLIVLIRCEILGLFEEDKKTVSEWGWEKEKDVKGKRRRLILESVGEINAFQLHQKGITISLSVKKDKGPVKSKSLCHFVCLRVRLFYLSL